MIEQVSGTDIYTVDARYNKDDFVAVHLIKAGDHIGVIDTGTYQCVDSIKAALQSLGLDWSHVDYIILTHIHLDHAGGASALMELCDNAKLVVHPKGARHMAEPERLIAGSISVYGEDTYYKLYGEIKPIEATRIISPLEGETLELGTDKHKRTLTFIDTPGHASHHHCIIDSQTNSIFTGDTLGLCYPALRDGDTAFLFPSTSPVQFKQDALHESINKVMSYEPSMLYLTHYGAFKPNSLVIAGLHEQIDDFVMLTQQVCQKFPDTSPNSDDATKREAELCRLILNYLTQRCSNLLPRLTAETIQSWVNMDAKLNAQGLLVWFDRKANS